MGSHYKATNYITHSIVNDVNVNIVVTVEADIYFAFHEFIVIYAVR